jgi:hypothetical protein
MANSCTNGPSCSLAVVLVAASVFSLPDPLAMVAALVLVANRCWMQVPSETSYVPLFSMPLLDLAALASSSKTPLAATGCPLVAGLLSSTAL